MSSLVHQVFRRRTMAAAQGAAHVTLPAKEVSAGGGDEAVERHVGGAAWAVGVTVAGGANARAEPSSKSSRDSIRNRPGTSVILPFGRSKGSLLSSPVSALTGSSRPSSSSSRPKTRPTTATSAPSTRRTPALSFHSLNRPHLLCPHPPHAQTARTTPSIHETLHGDFPTWKNGSWRA